MIVKITIFFAVVLFIWFCGMMVWFSQHPKEVVALHFGDYPKWLMAWSYCFMLEVVLVVVSVFWFLFLR